MKSSLSLALEEKIPRGTADPAQSLSAKALGRGMDYLLLIKLRLSSLALFTAGVGYLMAAEGKVDLKHFALTMLGTFLVVGAACAFNQVLERDVDAKMRRTANRPLPALRMSVPEALALATLMALGGFGLLSACANLLAALLAFAALALYLLAYTPLKPISPLCNFFGAIAGALPPLVGWAAVRNGVHFEGCALFALQFLWQFPHLWSIAWVYQTDYARAGFRIMPELEGHSQQAARKIVLVSLVMLGVSLIPPLYGRVSIVGVIGALTLGLLLVRQSAELWRKQTKEAARLLMLATMVYLPAVTTVMLLDEMLLARYF